MKKGVVNAIIGLVLLIVLVVAVAVPLTVQTLASTNSSLFQYTSAYQMGQLLPLLVILTAVIGIVGFFAMGRR